MNYLTWMPWCEDARAQVKVELGWVCNVRVENWLNWLLSAGADGNVSSFTRLLFLVSIEEPGVMALLNHDERDTCYVYVVKF
jgi:hypothetical protein